MAESRVFDMDLEDDVMIVAPRRNISSLAEQQVQAEWDGIVTTLEKSDVRHVVFDFHHVQYFGSSMLEAMLFLWKLLQREQGKMAVCNVSSTAQEILRLSKFDTIWPVCGTRTDAMDIVHGKAGSD